MSKMGDQEINEPSLQMIYLKPLEFSREQCNEVPTILQSWNLQESTCEIILSGGVYTIEHLESLEREDVNEIFTEYGKSYIGEKSQFLNHLRQWRKSKGIPMVYDCDTVSGGASGSILEWLQKISSEVSSLSRSSSGTCSHVFEDPNVVMPNVFDSQSQFDLNLKTLLEGSIKGNLILSYYRQNKTLDNKNQKEICHIICDFHKSKFQKMTYADMERWSKSIAFIFPNENSCTYFMERKTGKKNPTGKLHSRWVNVQSKIGPKQVEEDEEPDEIINTGNIDDLEGCKCWLANNFGPWDEVRDKWEKTASIRIPKFQNSSQPIQNLLLEWPRFDDPNGYQLIDIDFLHLFPSKQNLLLTDYDGFCAKILQIYEAEIKDKQSKLLLKSLKEKPMDKNSQHCITAMLLHSILIPKRLSKTFKPTILDAQTDFVVHITTINDLEPKLEGIRETFLKNKQPIQPRIIVVGTTLDNLK